MQDVSDLTIALQKTLGRDAEPRSIKVRGHVMDLQLYIFGWSHFRKVSVIRILDIFAHEASNIELWDDNLIADEAIVEDTYAVLFDCF